jgi:hypothetical protein
VLGLRDLVMFAMQSVQSLISGTVVPERRLRDQMICIVRAVTNVLAASVVDA